MQLIISVKLAFKYLQVFQRDMEPFIKWLEEAEEEEEDEE
jgi:hypothetical protein